MIRQLKHSDLDQVVELDSKWFGEYGISKEEVEKLLKEEENNTLGIFEEVKLKGFATFEILEKNNPKNYVGSFFIEGRIFFIQQFTTISNYQITNWREDEILLDALEEKARELKCDRIYIPLDKNHPYKKENNPDFDAFGFFDEHEYSINRDINISWSPNETISIPCFVFIKKLI